MHNVNALPSVVCGGGTRDASSASRAGATASGTAGGGCRRATWMQSGSSVRTSEQPIAPSAEELARLLAHDVRTPLNAIRGFAELLLAGAGGPLSVAAVGLLGEIARAGRTLETSIKLAQDLAEIECAQGGAVPKVELTAMLQSCGFQVARGSAEPSCSAAGGTREAWRALLETCRCHLVDDGSDAIATARLARISGTQLALILAASEPSADRAISTLRTRLIALMAAAMGIELISEPPHLPLRLRISCAPTTEP
jgi:signal transduction histidine kinase